MQQTDMGRIVVNSGARDEILCCTDKHTAACAAQPSALAFACTFREFGWLSCSHAVVTCHSVTLCYIRMDPRLWHGTNFALKRCDCNHTDILREPAWRFNTNMLPADLFVPAVNSQMHSPQHPRFILNAIVAAETHQRLQRCTSACTSG